MDPDRDTSETTIAKFAPTAITLSQDASTSKLKSRSIFLKFWKVGDTESGDDKIHSLASPVGNQCCAR
jgi:hypothetical protein